MLNLEMPPPPTEIRAAVDLDHYARKYQDHDAVYLFYEIIMEHTGSRDESIFSAWSFHRVRRKRYMILNPSVTNLTTFRINSKPKSLYVRLLYPDGSMLNYGRNDLIREKGVFGGDIWTLIYPAIVKGTIVDIGYEFSASAIYSAPLDHDIPLQFRYPCEKLTVSYAYPDWWEIQIKNLGPNRTVEYHITDNIQKRKRILTYEATNVTAVVAEPYSPYFKEIAKYLQFRVINLVMSQGKMRLPATWDLLSSSLRERVIDKGKKKENKLNKLADSLAFGLATTRDRAKAIVDYVQEEVKPGFSYQDRNYYKVLKEGVGSSFEITGLVWKLLNLCGVPAEVVMLSSAEDGYFDPGYVTIRQLGYPAISVVIDGFPTILFPYIETLPFGYIPGEFQGQTQIAITDMSHQFTIVPMGFQADNAVREIVNISISDSGLVSVEQSILAAGAPGYHLRESLKYLNDSEVEQVLQESLNDISHDVEIEDSKIEHLESRDEPLLITLSYSLNNSVTLVGDEAIFSTVGLLSPTSIAMNRLDSPDRANPIKIPYQQMYTKDVLIRFPASWRLKSQFADSSISNSIGWLKSHVGLLDNGLQFSQELVLRKTTQPRENARDVVALTGFGSGAQTPAIVFSTR